VKTVHQPDRFFLPDERVIRKKDSNRGNEWGKASFQEGCLSEDS